MTEPTENLPEEPVTLFVGPQWRVSISHVADGLVRSVDASQAICEWLTQELAVKSFDRLSCDMDIKPARRGRFAAKLHVRAKVVQECVITLETFDVHIDEHVNVEFWPERQIAAWSDDLGKETEFDEDSPDPEPIVDDTLDVGALVREALVMAIDPHPRKPDASFGEMSTETDAEREADRPFAALSKLRGHNDASD